MTASSSLLVHNVEIPGSSGSFDVVIKDGVVDTIVPTAMVLEPSQTGRAIDGGGGVLLPGLHDHHIHLMSMAARATSLDFSRGAVGSPAEMFELLEHADRRMAPGMWLRGVGYDDMVLPRIDRTFLDSVLSDRPIRIQHRAGHAWILNSLGLELLGLLKNQTTSGVERDQGVPTGWVYGKDALVSRMVAGEMLSLSAVGEELSRFGITAVTDATVDNDDIAVERFVEATNSGEFHQRIRVMGGRLTPTSSHRVGVGPVKVVLAEYGFPSLREVVSSIKIAHRRGSAVAIHAISREAFLLALTALEESRGPMFDRFEHASIAPGEILGRVAELGAALVTQFNFLSDHGDLYARRVPPEEIVDLYRGQSWISAGVPLAGGSDAPFGSSDPWLGMRAAVERRTSSGIVLNENEALSPEGALDLYMSPLESPGTAVREVRPGTPADLCLLRVPWSVARQCLNADLVAATIIAGRVVYSAQGVAAGD
jgi:predicted amidohydrolase YtcJ